MYQMALSRICILVVYSMIVNCQSLPQFHSLGEILRNNSELITKKEVL